MMQAVLQNACGDRSPDILVVNSGQHDRSQSQTLFTKLLWDVSVKFESVRLTGTKVLWKGNYGGLAQTHRWMNTVSQQVMMRQNISFVACDEVVTTVLAHVNEDCFTVDRVHYGAIALYHDSSLSTLISSMVTQALLNAL